MSDLWSSAINAMQSRVNAQTFDLWLRPIRLLSIDAANIRLAAPNRFMKEWFEAHYLEAVLSQLHEQREERFSVEIIVEEDPAANQIQNPAGRVAPSGAADRPHTRGRAETSDGHDVAETPTRALDGQLQVPALQAVPARPPVSPLHRAPPSRRPEPAADAPHFNARYDLSTFILGSCNELAASAAIAAAELPGSRYNPLFIYGDVGLGKTHLLQGIGRAITVNHPALRIAYLSAEQFMNEFVTAVRRNQFDEFRRKYRQGPDCLLIDDIQFISGRERTMDEFFHVFNALYESGKQIVVTADRTPTEMQGMEDRVISRLNWGLVADVQRPGIETRLAIVEQKAERDRIEISPRCRLLVAEAIDTNVRELEGALLRVAASAELRKSEITEELVRSILGASLERTSDQPLSIEEITKATCAYFSVRLVDIKGPRRHRGIARPRMIAMHLCRELTQSSFPEIGMKFGGRDHSTVINAHRRIRGLAEVDPDIASAVESLTSQLSSRCSGHPVTLPYAPARSAESAPKARLATSTGTKKR